MTDSPRTQPLSEEMPQKKPYSTPRMEPQGTAKEIVRSGAFDHDIEANWDYCVSSVV